MGKRGAKKLPSSQGGPNIKSVLRHEHLKNLALWSSNGETSIPSLASLFGRSFAADADAEATGIAINNDIVSCQRCETILKPGFNSKVRIEKASTKRGSSKGQMKEMMKMPEKTLSNMCVSSPETSVKDDQVEENTPKPMMLTLERDKRIRKSKIKKPIESESVVTVISVRSTSHSSYINS